MQQQSQAQLLEAKRKARAGAATAVATEQRKAQQQQALTAQELQKEKELLQSGWDFPDFLGDFLGGLHGIQELLGETDAGFWGS